MTATTAEARAATPTEAGAGLAAPLAEAPRRSWRGRLHKLAQRVYRYPRLLPLIAIVVLSFGRVWDPVPVQVLRARVFDLYQIVHSKPYVPQPVVIVDLDEKSLEAVGQWPWPRTIVAALVQQLFALGAVVVGFDVIFAEPDRTSPARVADFVAGLKPETVADLKSQPDNDAVLAQVFKSGRVVLGQAGVAAVGAGQAARPLDRTPIAYTGGDPRGNLAHFPYLLRSTPALHEAAAGHGMVQLTPETDGIVRRVTAASRVSDRIYPALTLEMLRVATGSNALLIRSDDAGIQGIAVGKSLLPTDRKGRVWLHYTTHQPARFVPAVDVLSGAAPKQSIAGKLVLVGSSATALEDIKATPLGFQMPGVEIQAQVLESILSGSFLHRPNYAWGAEVVGTLAAGLLIIWLLPWVGARWTLLLVATSIGSMAILSWYLYREQGMLFDVAYPAIATFLVYSLMTYITFSRSEEQREEVRNAFGRYLSPVLVEQLANDPERLRLGGEDRELTVLFCDIQGFTSISERFDARTLTLIINRFFTPMTDAILRWRGTVDKYMGDAVMAFWNAPLDNPDHARDACFAAFEMMRELENVNALFAADAERDGSEPIHLGAGIGLNTGICMVGNMGSDQRFDYSALGDPVNLASRLEGQTRIYGVPVIVGESVHAAAPDLAMLELDLLRVKGKREPARIFALLGDETVATSAEFEALRQAQTELLTAYRATDWENALQAIARCRERQVGFRLDGLYRLYEERVADFKEAPPPADWEGVYVATKK